MSVWDVEYSHVDTTHAPEQSIRDYYLRSGMDVPDDAYILPQEPITKSTEVDIDLDEISSLKTKKHKKKNEDSKYSDMYDLANNWFKHIHYKCLIFVFIIFILLSSDVFIRILANVDGAVDEITMTPTTTGVVIQGIILIITLIAFFTFIGI